MARDVFSQVFSWIYAIRGLDIEAKSNSFFRHRKVIKIFDEFLLRQQLELKNIVGIYFFSFYFFLDFIHIL